MSRDNSAQRMTAYPPERAILLDTVAGRPTVEHNGGSNGQKTVDTESLSGNCCVLTIASSLV
jgi:hypothetical protein